MEFFLSSPFRVAIYSSFGDVVFFFSPSYPFTATIVQAETKYDKHRGSSESKASLTERSVHVKDNTLQLHSTIIATGFPSHRSETAFALLL